MIFCSWSTDAVFHHFGPYHLRFIDASSNQLSIFPNLTPVAESLRDLRININSIVELQEELVAALTDLEVLYINQNLLTEIPDANIGE